MCSLIYGDSIDEVLTMSRGGSTYYYHYDGLGSVTDLTNSTGAVVESYNYDVYGAPSAQSTVGNPFYFTGRRLDSESGLFYFRARMYSPAIGRFLQRDPIGYYDSMNLFSYTRNNPINWTDPSGLSVLSYLKRIFDIGGTGELGGKIAGGYIGGRIGVSVGFNIGSSIGLLLAIGGGPISAPAAAIGYNIGGAIGATIGGYVGGKVGSALGGRAGRILDDECAGLLNCNEEEDPPDAKKDMCTIQ